ncbi:MAG: phosphatidate cytidylyltransferase [Firmicutes bacterium]|nr:phosphatidate cytidylyltransferase [Bacillota bacterium]
MFWERVVSSIVIVAVLFGGMYVGGLAWTALVGLLILGALKEYADMMKLKGYPQPLWLLWLLAVLVVVMQSYHIGIISEMAVLVAFVSLVLWLVTTQEEFSRFAFALVGYMMIAWSLSFLICLENIYEGWWVCLLAFLITWSTDAGAYCVGMLFGRHQMAPVISPKKSWEGAVGGVLITMLVVSLYNFFFLHYDALFMLVLALFCSIAGQIGDLTESWMKRWVGIKDSGNLIPGHGGLLDRFDSMMLLAPILYYLLILYHSIEIYFNIL